MTLAMVGEALISASVQTLLDKIASQEFRDFFASRKLNVSLLDELKIKLLALNAVLNDAEEKHITDRAVKAWLDGLKDVVFDAEDLLDEINTDSLRCKIEGEYKTLTTQVRSFLSSPFNQFYRSMNSKLERISRRIDYFVRQKDILRLQSVSRRVSYRKVTDSLVESVVVAREDDKEMLLSMLLRDDDDEKNSNIQVLTILGMGGLGKTTLAQYLYNDDAVQKHFDLKAWAWVSDDFDVFRVTKTLVESITSKNCNSTNFDALRVELKNSLKGKKFLLVLDDIWNDMYNDWNQLTAPFNGGNNGSKIIVTTRQQKVAQMTHTFPIYELKKISDENCWCLLARHAFGNEGYDKYPRLAEIGRKIAKKCDGLPLAAKTLGGLLRSNFDVKEWNRILKSNLWAQDKVLPALRISYLHLPAHLKRCFAYCSIFPKQHFLDRKELIMLWMAEGFLQQIQGEKAMESAGDDYFNELLSRSLIEKEEAVIEEKFRMHDLIYDLATLVSGKSSSHFEGGEIQGTVRHLAFLQGLCNVSNKFEGLYEQKFLRTILPLFRYHFSCLIPKRVSHDWLPKQRYLRSLSLSKYVNITELPDSISNLVLLRYLDLSYTSIKMLPNAIFRLYNLQTLKLSNCKFLTQLPEQIGNLVNLRHLDIRHTNLLTMPAEICKLQDLRVLTSFFVGKEDGLTIAELRKFPHLQGMLSILKLQNVVDPNDAFEADLKNKELIEELVLEWGSDPQDSQIEKDVLENLQPSTNLKKLEIKSYSGTSFPKWLGDSSYSNVVVLSISDCNYCLSLPPFGQLPSLKMLEIKRMQMVKIVGDEFYYNSEVSLLFQPFSMLESITFEEMSEWEEWLHFEGEDNKFPFPSLKRLSLSKCPKLRGNLPHHLPSLTKVEISECKQLEVNLCDLHWSTSIEVVDISDVGESLLSLLDKFSYNKLNVNRCDAFSSLPRMILDANCLTHLTLRNIPTLLSFPSDGLPTSLLSLKIISCENLQFLPSQSWHRYTSLDHLTISGSCNSLVSFPLGDFPSLKGLRIENCPNIEAISVKSGTSPLKLYCLDVRKCNKLRSLPELIYLPDLQTLYLYWLLDLESLLSNYLPSNLGNLSVGVGMLSCMSKHELGVVFQRLTSLSYLEFWGLGKEEDFLNTLLNERLLPTSLQGLWLRDFRVIKLLEGKGLHHLTSLQEFHICNCKSLESLPEDQLPSSLMLLIINGCPLLEARYKSQKGKYLSKIAHISIMINGEVMI